jgi:hypothetical protein
MHDIVVAENCSGMWPPPAYPSYQVSLKFPNKFRIKNDKQANTIVQPFLTQFISFRTAGLNLLKYLISLNEVRLDRYMHVIWQFFIQNQPENLSTENINKWLKIGLK